MRYFYEIGVALVQLPLQKKPNRLAKRAELTATRPLSQVLVDCIAPYLCWEQHTLCGSNGSLRLSCTRRNISQHQFSKKICNALCVCSKVSYGLRSQRLPACAGRSEASTICPQLASEPLQARDVHRLRIVMSFLCLMLNCTRLTGPRAEQQLVHRATVRWCALPRLSCVTCSTLTGSEERTTSSTQSHSALVHIARSFLCHAHN